MEFLRPYLIQEYTDAGNGVGGLCVRMDLGAR